MNRLVFIGFMGAGKSAVGQAVARELAWTFLDVDSLTLSRSGMSSINEIFDHHGEKYFRDLEWQTVQSLKDETNVVISTGGGAVMNPQLMADLKTFETTIVYVKAEFAELEKRLRGNNSRPLFRDIVKAQELYNMRLPYYQNYADITLETDHYTCSEAAEKLLKIIKE